MTQPPSKPTATPAGVRLCPLDQIADPGSHGFVLKLKAGHFHGFAVRRGATVRGYLDAARTPACR